VPDHCSVGFKFTNCTKKLRKPFYFSTWPKFLFGLITFSTRLAFYSIFLFRVKPTNSPSPLHLRSPAWPISMSSPSCHRGRSHRHQVTHASPCRTVRPALASSIQVAESLPCPLPMIPDFASKTKYSSHVCPESFIPHTRA
jgi:hypothetical protein